MSRNLLLLIGVSFIGSAAWLVDAMQLSPNAAFAAHDAPRIDALLANRVAFEQNVLEARAGLQQNFDPLNRTLLTLRGAADASERLRARGGAYAPAAERLALAARELDTEDAPLEQFKTDLTLLRLSSKHLPPAADALLRRAAAAPKPRQRNPLRAELDTLAALRTDAESYAQQPTTERAQHLEQGLSRLQTLRSALDDGAREDLDVLSGHARAILDRRERVDHLAKTLVRSPVRAHLEAARAAYERAARSHALKVGALQVLSAVLALAGLLILASAVLRSLRARRAAT